MNSLQEQFILWQIRKGKTEVFGSIYDTYNRQIHRYLEFRLPSQQDADDVTSQVFLKCYEYALDKNRPGIENIQAFLYRLARNSAADFYGDKKRREVSVADPSVHERPEHNRDDEEEDNYVVRRAEYQLLLARSLQDLKPEYREVILMRYNDAMSLEQIAEVLNKSEGTVRVLLHRAREALKKRTKE